MDISKLRKKHRQAQDKQGPEAPEAKPEEKDEHEESRSEVIEELPEAISEEEPPFEEETLEDEETATVTVQAEAKKAQEPSREVPAEEAALADIVELLVFKLSEELYAFRVTEVAEVLRPQLIMSVPRTVDFMPGVTSLRGKIIPVIDLRKRLQMDDASADKPSNIVILKGVGKGLIGVLVDKTLDVIRVNEKEIMQPPSHLADTEARFIEGVAAQEKSFISIIQPEELLDFNVGDI
jgi:purine-binding chemotaxis protein CheW